MNTPIRLVVNLKHQTYPIYIGRHLIASNLLQQYIVSNQVFIVSNEVVAPLYLAELKCVLSQYQCSQIILPDGEANKNLHVLSLIFDRLVAEGCRRNVTLIALGGGVIGDITGFAAACYQRGVNFIQIPTTLLSQVDASIGGKTGVNHPMAKNMIGAFYQPKAVFIDVNVLETLLFREYKSGIAEIVKAAVISDEAFFCWLEANMVKLMDKEASALIYAIQQACAIKIKIVVADEKEANIRAFLNLGHTFAHAIEKCLGYGTWLHGEAVAVGLVLAADLSYRLGWLLEAALNRIKKILTLANLPIRFPISIPINQFIDVMKIDKKKESDKLRLVLLKGIGQPVISSSIDRQLLEMVISENQK